MFIVICVHDTIPLSITKGKVYTVLSVEKEWYRIVDDTGEDYLYPPSFFKRIE